MDSYINIREKSLCLECMTSFPVNQCSSHKDSKTHRMALEALHKTPKKDEFYCKTCKNMGRKGSDHEKGKQHRRVEDVMQKYEKFLEQGNEVAERFAWEKESLYALKNHMMDDHGTFLLQSFKQEADNWYKAPSEDIQNSIRDVEDKIGNALFSLLLEVQKLKNESTSTKIRTNICAQYESIMNATKDTEASTLWLLKHNVSSAKDLLEILKRANNEVLIEDGFWIVQDNRKSGSVSSRHKNLSRLLDNSKNCRMKCQTSQFGTSLQMPIGKSYAEGLSFYLHDFIVQCMTLELAINDVMKEFIGDNGEIDAFREALFYNIPSKFTILYDQDLDLDRHFDTQILGFISGQSLVDARTSHLRVEHKMDYDNKRIELYNFSNDERNYIQKGDCKIAHSIPLVDDGFGLCTEAWIGGERPKGGFLRVIHGVTRGAIGASMFGTRTSIHVEDGMLATFNLLVLGAPKIWYIVPNKNSERFKRLLRRKGLLEATIEKRCFIQAFADESYAISESEMEDHKVHRVVQQPGMTVMTISGMIFHWTISTGFSLADSVNYHCQHQEGRRLEDLQTLWNSYEEIVENSQMQSSTTSSQYFDVCKKFHLFW